MRLRTGGRNGVKGKGRGESCFLRDMQVRWRDEMEGRGRVVGERDG